MAELIDISNERFWDILFDEACVEGQQAERIEKELKQITTTEAEIRAKAISEVVEAIKEHTKVVGSTTCEDLDEIAKRLAEQLKEE